MLSLTVCEVCLYLWMCIYCVCVYAMLCVCVFSVRAPEANNIPCVHYVSPGIVRADGVEYTLAFFYCVPYAIAPRTLGNTCGICSGVFTKCTRFEPDSAALYTVIFITYTRHYNM